MTKWSGFIIFVAGVAVGSAATWYYTKKKYEQIAQEEIDSVKATFSRKQCEEIGEQFREGFKKGIEETEEDLVSDIRQMAEKAKEKPSVAEYAKKLSKEGYTNYSNSETLETVSDEKHFGDPESKSYVISPDEFNESEEDYDVISLSYYADHILADDNDQIVEDVEGVVGFESLSHFGEYEDDSVYIRNDRLKVYYEILLDQRRYTDVIKTKPYLMED